MGIVMRSPAARWLPVLALLAVLLVAAAGGATAVPTADGPGDPPTTMRIAIQPNGDARWTVTARFTLDSANESRGFDRLAAAFEAGEAGVLSVDPFRAAATRAERATGRTMTIRDVSRRGARNGSVGRLTLSFRWTRFARVEGDRIEFGDAFRTPSGTWLPRLAPNQELVVDFPDRYAPVSTSHQLTNGSLRIEGPTTFDPGEPSATLVRQAPGPETTTAPPGGPTDTPTPTGPPIEALTRAAGIGAVLVVGIALAVLAYRRRGALPTAGDGEGAAAEGEGPPDDGPSADAPEAEEAPLLSDEERVLRLLEANGGRMKQAAIVTETDWSNAKVSQLLSEMDERGEIDKLRIGRENLISLPEETPEEFE